MVKCQTESSPLEKDLKETKTKRRTLSDSEIPERSKKFGKLSPSTVAAGIRRKLRQIIALCYEETRERKLDDVALFFDDQDFPDWIVELNGHNNEERVQERRGENGVLQIWQFLVDVLINCSNFKPYIDWTGNGLEFHISNPCDVFTEFDQRRRGEPATLILDPETRWHGNLIDINSFNRRYRHGLNRVQGRVNELRNANGDRIVPEIKTSGELRYYFDDHIQICAYLGWNLDELLHFIASSSKEKEEANVLAQDLPSTSS